MIINVIIGCAVVAVLLAVLTAIGTVTIERQYPPLGRFVDVTGGRMHVLERGQPDAPVVVLLHGASGNLQDVNAALGTPLAARYRVIMIDRPGHGWSDRPGGDDDTSPARQAALIAQALEKLGVTRAILVGVSWSGARHQLCAHVPGARRGSRTARASLAPVAGRHRMELSPGVDAGVGAAVRPHGPDAACLSHDGRSCARGLRAAGDA
jgi:pimeloyl-ACP methyl ester carboxylesterase